MRSDVGEGSRPSAIRARAESRLGQILHDKYRLERVLGIGGMATVYLAVHRNRNRVAIKILHPVLSSDEAVRARFVREGYLANSIDHRGVVRVIDDGVTEDGAALLVMELLEGETLAERAERQGPLPQGEVAALAHQLCDVLAAAHEQGIVHRDIKPANVFLTTDGLIKVLDFGIARMHDPAGGGSTLGGWLLGTPGFMPPEQALGWVSEVDGRSDIWSVGATMFRLLAGRSVHEGDTGEVLRLTTTTPVRPLREAVPAVAPELAAVVDRALALETEARFSSARDMRDAILAACEVALGGLPPAPCAPAPGARGPGPGGDVRARESADEAAALGLAPTVQHVSGAVPGGNPPGAATPSPPRRRRRWPVVALGLAALAAGGLGASLVTTAPVATAPALDAGPRRCATNGDCGAAQVCNRASVCQDRRGCATNAECMHRLAGKPSICRRDDGTCVELASAECRTLLMGEGDLTNDSTIWIGAMVPLSGPSADDGSFARVVDLARRDFTSVANGVPGARPGDPPRPLAVLLCDDGGDAAVPAHHLVDRVGVPAIIGFNRSKDVMDLATRLFNPRRVLALAALNQSPMLASIPPAPEGPRLVWRSTINSLTTAAALAAFAEVQIGPRLRLAPGEPARIVLVRRDNVNHLPIADRLVSRLRIEGRTVLAGGVKVRQLVVSNEQVAPDLAPVRREILHLSPHIVIDLLGAQGFSEELYPRVEREWPAEGQRPYYLTLGLGHEASKFVAGQPDARTRLFSPESPAKIPANVKLAIRYNEAYGTTLTPETIFSPPYDAFYVIAYAIAALGDRPVTGLEMARALARLLPPGVPVEVGPASIFDGLKALRDGKNIDLEGATTTLDFDLETGDSPVDLVFQCLKRTERGDLLPAETGVIYAARTGKLSGVLDCR